MFKNDYIMDQIESFIEMLGKLVYKDSMASQTFISEEGTISESGMIKLNLERFLNQNKLGEGEDYLFEIIDSLEVKAAFELAVWFYSSLNAISDEELLQGNFSREEIGEGIAAMKEILAQNARLTDVE